MKEYKCDGNDLRRDIEMAGAGVCYGSAPTNPAASIKRDVITMKRIQHPNVGSLFEVMGSKTKIYIVLEFVTGGELFDKIVQEGRMKEEEARRYFQHLINVVDYCHSRGVYHMDLKPENLLLDTNENLKNSNFGLSALSQQVWLLKKCNLGGSEDDDWQTDAKIWHSERTAPPEAVLR